MSTAIWPLFGLAVSSPLLTLRYVTDELGAHLVFAGLGGRRATTSAWHDNAASLAVTRALPYTEESASRQRRRDREDIMLSFSMTRHSWETLRRNDLDVTGIAPVREFLRCA